MENEKPNFVNHVFNFETESKNEFVNIIQYCVIGVIFITLLNKSVQTYLPDIDKDKGTIAIVSEIFIQVIILFVGVVFIHRIITYIPTMSGVPYADMNVITTILPVLIIMLSVSKLGEKVSILVDRFFQEPKATQVKLTPKQPISGTPSAAPQLLPPGLNTSNPMATPEPDFNTMFSGPNNPLQNAQEPFEPMPSNFGGSLF
jgi:hypothetical protein